jgi:2-polyprenyl-3-methyl-5-hydroxy-6-metoxy-1,4-benzoquinol methylase
MLVKFSSSKYYSKLNNIFFLKKKLDICEIGYFSGNNLRFFYDIGHNIYGVDVTKSIIYVCKQNLLRLGYNIKNFKLKVGHNFLIPFKKKFDVIYSINTLHYCVGIDVTRSIAYQKNKLKENGILIVETAAPGHEVFNYSKKISNLNYIFNNSEDFRNKQHFGFFDNKKHAYNVFKKFFNKVEIFHRKESYIKNKNFNFYQIICSNN